MSNVKSCLDCAFHFVQPIHSPDGSIKEVIVMCDMEEKAVSMPVAIHDARSDSNVPDWCPLVEKSRFHYPLEPTDDDEIPF